MNIALLMMGGSGVRFGADRPKQFVEINGKPLFSYILRGLNDEPLIDKIIIVVHADWVQFVEGWSRKIRADKVCDIVIGGESRSQSVRHGLKKAREFAHDLDVVLIHDATHPYVDHESMGELVNSVRKYGAATMAQRQYDTCYYIDANGMITQVIPRQYVVSGASPEGFLFGDIYRIYTEASETELDSMTSAGAIALTHGIRMKVCSLRTINLKITYPDDMKFLKQAPEYFLKTNIEEM